MVTFFQGKKILFIGPKTFNYETEIKNNLESLGAQVIYYNDKPFSNIFLIILLRVAPKLLWGISKKKFLAKLSIYANDYFDFIFIIKGEGVSPGMLGCLKKRYSKAKLVLYLWDSISNIKTIQHGSDPPWHCSKFQ